MVSKPHIALRHRNRYSILYLFKTDEPLCNPEINLADLFFTAT
jgi:hypothetical protein